MTTRLTEIACSLQRGDALAGAMTALDGWEARNIGAQRMRMFIADAHAWLAEAADEIRAFADSLCPYCHSANEAVRDTYCDPTCPGCVVRHFNPPAAPARRTWWQRIFGRSDE